MLGLGVEGPKYIAFRVAEGDRCVTVVATIEPDPAARFPWGWWYSELAPDGEYLKVPSAYAYVGEALATEMIGCIRAGQQLPLEFVAALPLVR